MKDNLIFLTELDLDKPVYRIFTFKRLMQLFEECKLTLVKPKLWDDPFENFILNSTGKFSDGREFKIGFRNNFYGQCWSLNKESDAMWRIYSPKKNGVKVKTTIRKLFTPIFQAGNINHNIYGSQYSLYSFIGKIKYSSADELIDMLRDKERMSNKIFDNTGWGQASSFYFKRSAFKHEEEIRIIYNNQKEISSDFFEFEINPNDLIDEIVFDPRWDYDYYCKKKKIIKNLGFTKSMSQSTLYKIRKFTIELQNI
jgi:hypothetical protein